MKLLVVLCLAAYVVSVLASGYLPGKEYVYKYKAKIFAELDEQHHQHAGVAFKSEVHVQPAKDFYRFKIDHVVYDKLNERVTNERGYDFQFKENQVLSEALQKPFKVYFEHGLVHHVKVATDDPIWSVNLKKSLAALFQLNFDQINPVRTRSGGHLEEPNLDAHYFQVMEDSLYGECETMYEISHEPSYIAPYTVPVLNVTKSVDFGHCVKVPYYSFENVNYKKCVSCESDQTIPDRLSNVLHYNLRGDRHNYVIEKVHTESEFTHMPWTRKGDMANVHTNRTLKLVEEREVKDEIQVASDSVNHYDLHFHFYGEHGFRDIVDLKEPHYYYHFLGKSADVDLIGKEFKDLVEPIIDGSFAEKFEGHRAPSKFVEIVKHIGSLGYDDIEKIYKTYVDVPSDDPQAILHKAHLFIEILVAAGTNPAFLFAKNHLFEPIVLPHVAAQFIQSLPFSIKESSETLFDEFYQLCESEKVRESHHLQSTCYLSLTSVVHEHCVGKNYLNRQRLPTALGESCTPEVAKKYFNYIARHFEDDHDDLSLITVIKAVGNLGLKEAVPYLQKYIDNDHYPTYFRVAAIWGLRRIAEAHPEAVLAEVIPVYFNLSENHEVRIAAFSIILVSHPSRSILEAIGVSLHEEHNHQVIAYVTSTLTHLSKSEYPCHKAIKRDVEHVMRHVIRVDHPPQFDLKHSQYWISTGFNEDYGFGGKTEVSYVTSNDSYLPSKIYVGLSDYVADRSIDSLGLIINQEGLDKFFDRLLGPEGLFKKQKSIFDIFHRRQTREAASVEKELKEIDDSLHIKTRHRREIHGDVAVTMFGHELSYFFFNESLFEEFFHDGYFGVPDIQNLLKDAPSFSFVRNFIQGNSVLILPSCVGFPIFLAYQEPTTIYYKNDKFKFEVSPSVFSEDRNSEAPSGVTVGARGHFIHDTVRRGVLGISLTFEHTTVGVGIFRRTYLNQPVNVEANVDLKTWQITLKKKPALPNNWIHICAHPFTYVDDYSNDLDSVSEDGYLPYWKLSEMGEFHEKYLHDHLGAGLDVRAKYGKLNVFQTPSHAREFFAEHSLRDISYLLHFNPHIAAYEFEINVTAAEQDPTTEVELQLDFDYHHPGKNQPFHSELYNEHHHDLEDHAKSLPGRKFYTYAVNGHLIRKGSRERKAVAELTYTHSCDHKLQKFTVYYDRTPYLASETEHFKVCANAYLRYPDYDMKKLHDLDTLALDQEVKALANIGYGKDCKEDQKITVHGVLKRSAHQIELDAKREVEDHLHFNPYSHYYHKCKEEHSRGAYYDINCRKYIYYTTLMNHYDIDFEFETTPTKHFINNTRKFFDWLDHKLYYHLEADHVVEGHDQKKIELHLDFSPETHTVDIELIKPIATVHYHDVPLHDIYSPISASPYMSFNNKARINEFFRHTYCSVEGEYVKTYDNVTYQLPDIDCWKVLSKDCSEKEYFLVLGKKTNYATHTKAVRVFLGKSKVEILPIADGAEPIVRVDGKKVDVTQDSPYFLRKEGEKPVFYVTYNGLYYTINSPKYGVTVFYDGKAIVTEISLLYRGKQCGLCGDFNRETDREFRGPEDCIYHNVTEFAASYAIHEDGCHAPEVKQSACEKPRHRDPCTVLRNRYVYVGTTNRELCFTTVPIPECSKECVETKKVTSNLGYHCLPAKEGSTRNLQRLSKERVLYELRGKVETHFAEDSYPESCQPIQF